MFVLELIEIMRLCVLAEAGIVINLFLNFEQKMSLCILIKLLL